MSTRPLSGAETRDHYVFLQAADAMISIELHVFCYASPRAYGTFIYVRARSMNGGYNSQLLISKSRVAPLKHISLPRLELLACVVGTRLCAYVKTVPVLSSVPEHFWTDSLVTLHWTRNTPAKRETFVRHRVSEIHSLTRRHSGIIVPERTIPLTWLHEGFHHLIFFRQ